MNQNITPGTKVTVGRGSAVWRVSAAYLKGPNAGHANLLSTDGRYRARYLVAIDRLHVLEDQR